MVKTPDDAFDLSIDAQCRRIGDAEGEVQKRLAGWSLATAEIFYRMPDARSVLQTFVWQDYDIAPRFPQLRKFLEFWTRELDGPIHSVRLCHTQLVKPAEVRMVGTELRIH